MLKVGFIGLGTMGYPIAGHISKYYETVVFNRTIKKSQKWTSEFDGEICKSVEDLVSKFKIDMNTANAVAQVLEKNKLIKKL